MTFDGKSAGWISMSTELACSDSKSCTCTEYSIHLSNFQLAWMHWYAFTIHIQDSKIPYEHWWYTNVGHVSANWSHLWAQYMPKRALKTTHYYLIKSNWCNSEPKAWKSHSLWIKSKCDQMTVENIARNAIILSAIPHSIHLFRHCLTGHKCTRLYG